VVADEYCAGVLWGGFERPLSRNSAVYQIVLGFILLVVNASCICIREALQNTPGTRTCARTPTVSPASSAPRLRCARRGVVAH
jgi:hypothetical protein